MLFSAKSGARTWWKPSKWCSSSLVFHFECRITGQVSGLISSASEALSLDPDMNPWVLLAEEEREEVGGVVGNFCFSQSPRRLEEGMKWTLAIWHKRHHEEHIKRRLYWDLCDQICSPGMGVCFVPSFTELIGLSSLDHQSPLISTHPSPGFP